MLRGSLVLTALLASAVLASAGCGLLEYDSPTRPSTPVQPTAPDALTATVSYSPGLALVTFTAWSASQPLAHATITVDVPGQTTTSVQTDGSGQATITVTGQGVTAVTARSGSAILGLNLTIP